jgi:hypothetical protein
MAMAIPNDKMPSDDRDATDLPTPQPKADRGNIIDFLNQLPAGTRSKEDIDEQIREERDSWGDR